MRDTLAPPATIGPELTIIVRAGGDPDAPHRGQLTIGAWTTPCVVGRSGIVSPAVKREGDGATPAGRFALRYGFYEPGTFADETMAALAFPFKPKPADYDWIEDPTSGDYNRMRAHGHNESGPAREAKLFDMFVPLGWNDAVPLRAGGSAIFLHAARPEMTGTAGCVAVPHDVLMEMAQRLRPGMIIDIAAQDGGETVTPAQDSIETHSFIGLQPGPRVVITGAVHGNEPCGPLAINRMIADLRAGRQRILRGSVTFVPVVNTLAYRNNTREGDRNLNRALTQYPIPANHEDRTANILCPLLGAHDVLIDLHSFSAEGPAFALIGPANNSGSLEPFAKADVEMALAGALGLPLVMHGWLPAHQRALMQRGAMGEIGHAIGTSEYMRFAGGAAITVECGRHSDADTVETAYQVIARGLAQLGILTAVTPTATCSPPEIWEISSAVFAEAADDKLARRFQTGELVKRGQQIGLRANKTPITAPDDGAIIFDSGQVEVGRELCFFCVRSGRT